MHSSPDPLDFTRRNRDFLSNHSLRAADMERTMHENTMLSSVSQFQKRVGLATHCQKKRRQKAG